MAQIVIARQCPCSDCAAMSRWLSGNGPVKVEWQWPSRVTSAGAGPFPLDLGDLLYAPNCFEDGRGRHIMLGWLQEHASREGDFDYAGCLTLPRILTVRGKHVGLGALGFSLYRAGPAAGAFQPGGRLRLLRLPHTASHPHC